MRELVGPTEPAMFDNPTGTLVYPYLPAESYRAVFDFGCGCGRVARQLIQQSPRPTRYLGIDLHAGMIRWCRDNLAPHAAGFDFQHHDIGNVGLNPGAGKPHMSPFPADDSSFTLVNAWSVFTHLVEDQAGPYLGEVARVLSPGGFVNSTWFLFDKQDFPMMQESQNALYINRVDPTNAVVFDRSWLRATARSHGLAITSVFPATTPPVRGYQWVVVMRPLSEAVPEASFPPDMGEIAVVRASNLRSDAHRIGLDPRSSEQP